ncbi:MFS transporter [Candidatus Uhrbacteria bacterium]|nr:MFS transporter [Candidatus Uhrbacteria bacterium]
MRTNLLYKILITGYSFSIFSEAVILPIYAVFVQGIGGDILDAAGAMAVFLITQGLFTIVTHRFFWVHRHSIPVMVGGWAVWVSGIAMYLMVSNVLTLFIAQIFIALGNAIADPIFDKELARHTDHKNEEFEWGVFEGSQSIIQGVAAVIGGLIVSLFSFQVLIYLMVATATVSLGMIIFYYSKIRKDV